MVSKQGLSQREDAEAREVYFLVERPGPGGEWRGGRQQLFGPFARSELPAELAVE